MEFKVEKHHHKNVIIGSGTAGYAMAQRLLNMDESDVVIVTEGINMGTSRNTGSDKQTYYKLSMAGELLDSVESMANTLFSGGAVDGDIALIEAALSARGFFNLVELGVPFPSSRHGQYVGYKTDHDPSFRASSVGPLTSKKMTETLQAAAEKLGLKYLNKIRVVRLIISNNSICGLIGIERIPSNKGEVILHVITCNNLVWAAGGSAGIYGNTVYPNSQTGGLGAPILAGCRLKNITEWQYGIASTKFKWNLSGTYQQVIPKYISTDKYGNEGREFLLDGFDSLGIMLTAVFLKGYQWPFNADRCDDNGSSVIDVLVHKEINEKGRRVFLDFSKNPYDLNIDEILAKLSIEGREYLLKSGGDQPLPIDRLSHMNERAINLYANHGIDLYTDLLEISVCAQHQNGGLETDLWWETNIDRLYCVGEAAGTHGVTRPGGSALNAGQVGAIRCAQHIAKKKDNDVSDKTIDGAVKDFVKLAKKLLGNGEEVPKDILCRIQKDMDKNCAHIRDIKGIRHMVKRNYMLIKDYSQNISISTSNELYDAFLTLDILYTQTAMLVATSDYFDIGGCSRGSALYLDKDKKVDIDLTNRVQSVQLNGDKFACEWRDVRQIPHEDLWFENVFNLNKKNIDKRLD